MKFYLILVILPFLGACSDADRIPETVQEDSNGIEVATHEIVIDLPKDMKKAVLDDFNQYFFRFEDSTYAMTQTITGLSFYELDGWKPVMAASSQELSKADEKNGLSEIFYVTFKQDKDFELLHRSLSANPKLYPKVEGDWSKWYDTMRDNEGEYHLMFISPLKYTIKRINGEMILEAGLHQIALQSFTPENKAIVKGIVTNGSAQIVLADQTEHEAPPAPPQPEHEAPPAPLPVSPISPIQPER